MENEDQPTKSSFEDSALLAISGAMICAAIVFVIYGLRTAYTYNSLSDAGKIVGGDAYNYIIIGVRGLAWVTTGLVCAVFAVLFAMLRK